MDDPVAPARNPGPDGLLRSYFFVRHEGASAYASLDEAQEGTPDRELEGGWGVAVVEQRAAPGGSRWARTSKGLWIDAQDLGAARPSLFHGEALGPGDAALDLAWVVSERAPVWPDATTKKKPASSSCTRSRSAAGASASATPSGWTRATSPAPTRPRPRPR